MERGPLVSCITIFLNEERFLGEAVASVLAQTYADWELLLVDDGSTDGSAAIARSYAARQPERIRCLTHEGRANRGMSASRNLGLRHARGRFVAFLDADDVWLPGKLAAQVPILQRHPEAAMVFGRTEYWFGWTGRPEDAARDHLNRPMVPVEGLVRPPELLTRFLTDGHAYPAICSVLVRREAFDRFGRFEESFRDANEDMVFHTKLFLNAPVFVTGACHDRYRMHPGSYWATARRTGSYTFPEHTHPGLGGYFRWAERYLETQGCRDATVRAAFRRASWPYRRPMLYRLARLASPKRLLAGLLPAPAYRRLHAAWRAARGGAG